ncbi:2-hydroxyacyl-CoA dehydratase subunit D [bacterium]
MRCNTNNREMQFENLRKFLKQGKSQKSPYYTLKATSKRAKLLGKLLRRAYKPDSIVAWRNSFVPSEIFHALDIVPFFVEGFSSMLSGSGLSAPLLNKCEKENYSTDTCSFLRCGIGAAVEDILPSPNFVIATSHYCDGAPIALYNLSKKYNADFYLIDVPYDYNSPEAVDYVAEQLKDLTMKLAVKLGKSLDVEDRLKEVIGFSNKAREYFVKINELRKHRPCPMLGGEAIDYVALLSPTWGSKEVVEIYELLYEELKERVEKKIGALKEEKYRILWRNLRPYYNDRVLNYLENECKAVIVFEEVNEVVWGNLDIKNPFHSLASKLLANSALGEMKHRLDLTILNPLEEYEIDGVIGFAHWGCRHLNGNDQIFRDILIKKNMPFLVLDGDCIENRNFSFGQIKTRIDAFIEKLEQKKGEAY